MVTLNSYESMKAKDMENLNNLKDILVNLVENLESEIASCKYLVDNGFYDNVFDKMNEMTDSLEAAKAISMALKNYQNLFPAGS
ncbi:MAG: hypothetical protein GF329_22275 [Candidatus Lokiarchaeota archaeon]|nr:hypothetical protein [Candidatus Lokiarchaeota archaeon]